MFKRAKPHSLLRKLRELCWPSMGWKRAFYYAKHRVLRLSDTPRNVAMGLAVGVGVSFSPIMGTHLFQAAFLAWILRGNILASLIGTVIGNPWTFPFIWWASLSFGLFLFDLFGVAQQGQLPDDITFSVVWDMMWNEPLNIFLPWLLGGTLLCFISIPLAYWPYYHLVKGAQLARAMVINQRRVTQNEQDEAQ